MIQKIPASDRYHSVHNWLSTYHLFSFADYYDPDNMNFGVLRVFNDDTIDAHSGFGEHGHRDMEIITIVIEGELTHTDSMGNSCTIKKGEVQYMSAGTGVMHSEVNGTDSPVHLYQLWFLPSKKNLAPVYAQRDFSGNMKSNELVLLASCKETGGSILIQTDASIFSLVLEQGKEVMYDLSQGRGLYVYIEKGILQTGEYTYEQGDQARIIGEDIIRMYAQETIQGILIDVKV